MAIALSPEYERFVREKVSGGGYASEREVIEDGLRMMRREDALSAYTREEINAMIAEGQDSLDRGEGIEWNEDEYTRLIEEVLAESRQRRSKMAR